jgi:hypothetical protein
MCVPRLDTEDFPVIATSRSKTQQGADSWRIHPGGEPEPFPILATCYRFMEKAANWDDFRREHAQQSAGRSHAEL